MAKGYEFETCYLGHKSVDNLKELLMLSFFEKIWFYFVLNNCDFVESIFEILQLQIKCLASEKLRTLQLISGVFFDKRQLTFYEYGACINKMF